MLRGFRGTSTETAAEAEARIERTMRTRLAYYQQHRDEIDWRLAELDEELPLERALQGNVSGVALAATVLGVLRSRWFFALPVMGYGLLMQNAARGGGGPAWTFLRRRGYRTLREIEIERNALRALRGDFDDVTQRTPFDGVLSVLRPLVAQRGRVRYQTVEEREARKRASGSEAREEAEQAASSDETRAGERREGERRQTDAGPPGSAQAERRRFQRRQGERGSGEGSADQSQTG